MTDTEQNVQQAVPFFGVSDMQASVKYYVDGLGFEMTRKWAPGGQLRWAWLQLGGAALMLQQFGKEDDDSWRPEGKVGVGVNVCFQCRDALEIYHTVRRRSIVTNTPFVGNNMWVVSMTDSDGYHIEFESPTDVSEGTVYAEPEAELG